MTRPAAVRLADAIRELVELMAAAALPETALDEAAAHVEAATASLRGAASGPRPYIFGGPDTLTTIDPLAHQLHSPVSGRRNPLAPPLRLRVLPDATVRGEVRFGRAHEGPPGCVHGALVAAAFDEVLGLANTASGNPGMTVRLAVRYLRPTPLHAKVDVVGRHTGRDGRRILASGRMLVDGEATAEAEGVFAEITPERARRLFGGIPGVEEVDHGAAL